MVFLIALVPAFIVLLVGAMSKRTGPTLTVAIIAALIGAATGSPVYMALDLLCVLVAYLIASSFFKQR